MGSLGSSVAGKGMTTEGSEAEGVTAGTWWAGWGGALMGTMAGFPS